MCSFLFCLKESVERITLLNLQFCWFYWFKSENTHYQKLWTSLERREKQALRSTKNFISLFDFITQFLLLYVCFLVYSSHCLCELCFILFLPFIFKPIFWNLYFVAVCQFLSYLKIFLIFEKLTTK